MKVSTHKFPDPLEHLIIQTVNVAKHLGDQTYDEEGLCNHTISDKEEEDKEENEFFP